MIGIATEKNLIEGTTCMDETVHEEGKLTALHERAKPKASTDIRTGQFIVPKNTVECDDTAMSVDQSTTVEGGKVESSLHERELTDKFTVVGGGEESLNDADEEKIRPLPEERHLIQILASNEEVSNLCLRSVTLCTVCCHCTCM